MKIVAILFAALLAGCATAPPLETGPKTVRVEIPVRVPCIAPADAPAVPRPVTVNPETATREQLAAALGATVYALRDYAKRADAVIVPCTANPQP